MPESLPHAYGSSVLRVENLSLAFGADTPILRDINFDILDVTRPGITQGQIVGLLGPSGIGKTLLFEMLSGLRRPTTGTICINNKEEAVSPGRVGVVQQHYPLFQHRTLRENLEVALRNRVLAAPERQTIVNTQLDRLGLLPHASKYPAQLSGGQRQRAAIAQQLLCSGQFLLLDEPFSGLDPRMVTQVQNLLREVTQLDELNTVILISHDIVATTALADTLLVIGRETLPDGTTRPGATIRHRYDLVKMGLAWRENVERDPEFIALVAELRSLFDTL